MALPQHFNEVHNICCIGARHASVMSMAIIAEAHPDKVITIVDYDFEVLQSWVQLNIDFIEPGFLELLDVAVNDGNLLFDNQVEQSINEAQMVFICVDIPTKNRGVGARSRPDRSEWERAIRSIVTASQTSKIIVEKTNMPIDTGNDTMRLLRQSGQGQVEFAVFSNPDLYTPGRAIENLRNPDQVIIARKSNLGNPAVLREMYLGFPALAQHPERIAILDNYVSVELARTGTSIMLGAKTIFTNMLSSVCSSTSANYNEVRQVVGGDHRLSNQYMDATLGIGPDTMKDMLHFKYTLQKQGLRKQAKVINELVKLNKQRIKEFVEIMLDQMVSLKNKVVAVFGVTCRSGVADVRNSPAIQVCKALLIEGAILRIFDPLVAGAAIRGCFRNGDRVTVAENQQETYDQAHATLCLVATNLVFNFQEMRDAMVRPPYLFIACDLHNINYIALQALGFQYYISYNQFN